MCVSETVETWSKFLKPWKIVPVIFFIRSKIFTESKGKRTIVHYSNEKKSKAITA